MIEVLYYNVITSSTQKYSRTSYIVQSMACI
jgi:hypothetical protein